MSLDSGGRRQLTHNRRPTSWKFFNPYNQLACDWSGTPVWSPDGSFLAYLDCTYEACTPYIADRDGRHATKLRNAGDVEHLVSWIR